MKAALPATTLVGEMLVSEGVGLLTVKVTVPLVPPPGGGVEISTDNVPALAVLAAGIVAVT